MTIDSIHRLSRAFPIAATRTLAVAIALAVVAVAVSSWWPLGSGVLAPMQIKRSKGSVEVVRDGETLRLREAMELQVGDVIVTGAASAASIRLEGARRADIGESARVRIIDTSALGNDGGDVLVRTSEAMRVMFGEVAASADQGVFRVDSGFAAARAATYDGTMSLTAPGEPTLEVPRLFEAQVSGNDLPASAKPYELRLDDNWDRVLLPRLIDLDIELTQLGAGLDAQVGKRRLRLGFFRSLADGRSVGFVKPLLDRRSSDLLIAFTLARNTDAGLERTFTRAFDLFDEGGRWSIVAAILNVSFDPLVAQLDRAIARFDLLGRNRGGGPQFVEPDDNFAFVPGDDGGDDPSQPPDDDGPRDPDPNPKPKKPKPSPSCDNPVDCTIGEILPEDGP